METLHRILDIQEVTEWVVLFIPKFIVAVLILIAFLVVYRVTRRPLGGVLERAGFDRVLVTLLVQNIYRFALVIFGLVMAASQLGVNVGAALAGIGVVGIANHNCPGQLVISGEPDAVMEAVRLLKENDIFAHTMFIIESARTPLNRSLV